MKLVKLHDNNCTVINLEGFFKMKYIPAVGNGRSIWDIPDTLVIDIYNNDKNKRDTIEIFYDTCDKCLKDYNLIIGVLKEV